MINPQTAAVIQGIVKRESRSLLQYVSDSFPWITSEERQDLDQLKQLIDEERQAAAALGLFLVRQHVAPPMLGPYPMDFTTINYVSLDHLLPMLATNQKAAIDALERDLATLDDSEARTRVEKILAMKQRHLGILGAMAAAHPNHAAALPQTAAAAK